MLDSLEGLRQEAQLVRSVPGGHLAIGTIPSAVQAATILGGECRRLIPGLTLEIYSLSTKDILQRLKKHDLHFGVTYSQIEGAEGYDILPLFRERYVLVSGGAATIPRSLSWQDVARLPLCLFNQEMQNRRILDNAFQQQNVYPHVVMETNTTSILFSEAQSGRLFSIMPVSALPRYFTDLGVRIHTIVPECTSELGLLRAHREAQPPLSSAVWKFAANMNLQRIIDGLLNTTAR